jgi:succinyl-diaminopimelate desuccinylase
MSKLSSTLTQLVSFQTVEGYQAQKLACFDYLEKRINGAGVQVTRQNHNGEPSIVATTQDTKKPKVLLQAHLDVVPGGAALFHLKKDEGKLIGRGTYDMKFAAACFLEILDELKENLDAYDFGIMFTADEEIGGENGVMQLIDQGYSSDVCILPDGGNDWKIESNCNGCWFVRLTARGETAHGSRPWEGSNAIENILGAVNGIQEFFVQHTPEMCTLTVSQISGGSAINQVPDHAEVTLDMRFIDHDHFERKRKLIETIAIKRGLQLETVALVYPAETDLKHPHVAKFIEIAGEISGHKIGKTRSFGSSDARYFNAIGVPTILIRPSGGGAHSDKEWIDEAELEKFYQVIKQYVTEVARMT